MVVGGAFARALVFAASTGEIKGRRTCTLRSDSNQLAHDTATTTTHQSLPAPKPPSSETTAPAGKIFQRFCQTRLSWPISTSPYTYPRPCQRNSPIHSFVHSLSANPVACQQRPYSYPPQKSTKCATTTAMCTLAATSSCASPTFASRRPECSGHARPGPCGRALTSIKTVGRVEGRVERV